MSITVDPPTATVDLAFTLDQLTTLLTWSAGKPLGLDISLAFDHQGFLEVAEIIRCDPREVLYSLEPSSCSTVTLAGAYAGRCEFNSVEAALGRVLELDDGADRPDWGRSHADYPQAPGICARHGARQRRSGAVLGE